MHVTCNGDGDGAIYVTVTGGTGVYSYVWTDGAGFNETTQDIETLVQQVVQEIINQTK